LYKPSIEHSVMLRTKKNQVSQRIVPSLFNWYYVAHVSRSLFPSTDSAFCVLQQIVKHYAKTFSSIPRYVINILTFSRTVICIPSSGWIKTKRLSTCYAILNLQLFPGIPILSKTFKRTCFSGFYQGWAYPKLLATYLARNKSSLCPRGKVAFKRAETVFMAWIRFKRFAAILAYATLFRLFPFLPILNCLKKRCKNVSKQKISHSHRMMTPQTRDGTGGGA